MPPGPYERLVQALKVLDDGQAIHDHEPLHGVRVTHGRAESQPVAPVMTHDREPVVAEVPHQCHDVACHCALGRLRVLGRVRRQRRLAITAQVRTDHEERTRKPGRHPVPGRVRPGMTVQQHHRLPLAAVAHSERHLADINAVQLEAIEHQPHLPMRSSANRDT